MAPKNASSSEIRNKRFWFFILGVLLSAALIVGVIVGVNYTVDASHVITSRSSEQMAVLALEGNAVAVPENYNERTFQMAIVDHMSSQPETLVLGCSRGMYLGTEVTGFESLYNHCINGSTLEDAYAVLQLHRQKFGKVPQRVILEVSPWVLYDWNPEVRWTEIYTWRTAAEALYNRLNEQKMVIDRSEGSPYQQEGSPFYSRENPYFSLPYFQYNCLVIRQKGLAAFNGDPARVSADPDEAADLPDGSVRKDAFTEHPSPERLAQVRATVTGAVTYENVQQMAEVGKVKGAAFEALVKDLQAAGCEVVFFLQPFCESQCVLSLDEGLNPAFTVVENYLKDFAEANRIKVVGSYDCRPYGLTDEDFSDYAHLDKAGYQTVWDTDW